MGIPVLRLSTLQRFFHKKDTYFHVEMSVLETFMYDGMSVLRGSTATKREILEKMIKST